MKFSKKMLNGMIFIIIILISFILNIISIRDGHNWGGDFSRYLKQTESLSAGNLEEIINYYSFCENTSSRRIAPVLYPWGFPILLWPIYKGFGFDPYVIKIFIVVFYMFSLYLIYRIFEKELEISYRLLLVSLFAFNPYFFSFKENIVADIPFFFFSLLSLHLINNFCVKKRVLIGKNFDMLIVAVVIFLAIMIKTLGVLLLICLLIVLLRDSIISGRKIISPRNINLLIPFFVVFLLLAVTNIFLPLKSDTYLLIALDNLSKNPLTVLDNLMYYTQLPSEFFYSKSFFELIGNYLNFPKDLFYNFNYTINIALIITGFSIPYVVIGVRSKWREQFPICIFILISIPLLLFFEKGGLRLIFPILPYYLFFFIMGLKIHYSSFKLSNFSKVVCWLIIIYFIYQISILIYHYRKNPGITDGPYTVESRELFMFIKINSKPNDVFIFRKPTVLYFYANRSSFMVSSYLDLTDKRDLGDYLIIDKKNLKDQVPLDSLQSIAFSKDYKNVFENKNFFMYKIKSN